MIRSHEIAKNIYWVGGVDWDLRNFHGYLTQKGTSYNAYLVLDDHITLIDTVKQQFSEEMMERIRSIVDPKKISYVITNHVEMDHSGALPTIMNAAPHAAIVTNAVAAKGLEAHYHNNWMYKIVSSGDTLSLGSRSLHFLATPMIHWPDNMLSYMAEEKILFSNDAFGQHIASSERFDDEYSLDITLYEARKYYANIVLPYSSQVQKALEVASTLPINIIAPSHGVIWRKYISDIISNYKKWAYHETEKCAVIVYDTMWHSTEKIANTLASAFEASGYNCMVFNLQCNHISDIIPHVMRASHVCIGSPTLNKNMMPLVAGFMTYLRGLMAKGDVKKAIAFGSYGWGQMSVSQMESQLSEIGFEVIQTIEHKYIPTKEALSSIRDQVMQKIAL